MDIVVHGLWLIIICIFLIPRSMISWRWVGLFLILVLGLAVFAATRPLTLRRSHLGLFVFHALVTLPVILGIVAGYVGFMRKSRRQDFKEFQRKRKAIVVPSKLDGLGIGLLESGDQ